jgi:hypothetical protein
MPSITVTRKTHASPATCWRWLSDFKAIDAFNPTLKESHLLDGSCEIGLGAERQCTMKDGRNYIHERVIEWTEGQGYTIEVFNGTMPLTNIIAKLNTVPSGTGSEISMQMSYRPKWGLFGKMLEPVALRPYMRHTMRKVVKGLADQAESDSRSNGRMQRA